MKSFLAIALVLGCMAFLEARVLTDSAEQGAGVGNPFSAGGSSNNGNGLGGRPVIGPGGGAAAAGGGNDNADDGGGDTPDDSPGGPRVVGAGGGYGYGRNDNDGGGDTPDGVDSPDVNSPVRPYGSGGRGNTVVNNPDQRVVDDRAEAADPGQIVGSAGSTGATIGIVAGVVALVGVAAGVAIYVIKKRN